MYWVGFGIGIRQALKLRFAKEDPQPNPPHKHKRLSENSKVGKTKTKTRRESRVSQQDSVAGSTRDALRSPNTSAVPTRNAPLVRRTGVCSGNVYCDPEEPTPPSQPKGLAHPANVFKSSDGSSSRRVLNVELGYVAWRLLIRAVSWTKRIR
ncbi:hypothetical protein EDD18DRAFT_1211090 [Armillaria luteobubalina]|uniref:Uncharacterized protein n=1 Tax=Armillaria luteobubalina TaxID=153913 RepID=A0AA39P419_9AGAR|nr:hypothetical protein EDD18DRAFT_1211090 [Armillaria luteobubalina]